LGFSQGFESTLETYKSDIIGAPNPDYSKGEGNLSTMSTESEMMKSFARLFEVSSAEQKADRALEEVVEKNGLFNGRNISRYLRQYDRVMMIKRISDEDKLFRFAFAVEPELVARVEELQKVAATWSEFEKRIKKEYMLRDTDRVTQDTIIEWVSQRDKKLTLGEMFDTFEKLFNELSDEDQAEIKLVKTRLFLRAVNKTQRDELEKLLEDKEDPSILRKDWKMVQRAVDTLEARQRRKMDDDALLLAIKPERKATDKLHGTSGSEIDELIRGMKELKLQMAQILTGNSAKSRQVESERPRSSFVPRCIWCDKTDHLRKGDCEDLREYVQKGIVVTKEGKLHFSATEKPVPTNFGRGGMKKLVDESLVTTSSSIEAMAYEVKGLENESGTRSKRDVQLTTTKSKLGHDVMKRSAVAIRKETGWDLPVDAFSIQAYVSSSKQEAFVDEKRRRELEAVELPAKRRQTNAEGQMGPFAEKSGNKGFGNGERPAQESKKEKRDPAFKLQSEIEASTDLKGVLEERILSAKIELTIREALGIAKREFHEHIMDIIKRKRQISAQTISSEIMDTRISKDEELEIANCLIENRRGGFDESLTAKTNQLALTEFENPSCSHAFQYWARATTECVVKLQSIDTPLIALLDHGSEINLIDRSLYEEGQWPIDRNHGWFLRVANNSKSEIYGACPNVKVQIGHVGECHNFFIQDGLSCPIILGQPFITRARMGTQVLDDGTHWAKIKSIDGEKEIQFLTVPKDHKRHRTLLNDKDMPRRSQPESEVQDFC
jgi:hypothetical protein